MAESMTIVEAAPVAVAAADSPVLSLVQALAVNPDVSVEKMERIIALQTQLLDREAERAFGVAFAAMQAGMEAVKERGEGNRGEKGGSYTYAKYEDVMDAIRPHLKAHGFGIHHETAYLDGGRVRITGVLTHALGHQRRSEFVAQADSGGGKNSVQAFGSSTSYGRRYTTYDLLGLATRGQDDDGAKSDKPDDPDWFDDWLSDLDAEADNGWPALSKAWNASPVDRRNFMTRHRAQDWNRLKAKAQAVARG